MLDLRKQKLLIVSPHPDDEVLGCGGLIKKVKDAGGKVYVLFLTVGTTQDYSKSGKSTDKERLKEIEAVAKFMKFDDYKIAFPGDSFHLRLDDLSQKDIMHEIERGKGISLDAIKPTIVLTPPAHDYNQDHRAATNAVIAATRPAPEDTKPLQKLVLGYESVPTAEWGSGTFRNPNFFIPISEKELDAKLKALSLYKTQVRQKAHPRSLRSVKTLAAFRGIACGSEFAESYFVYRHIL